jgi:hypothetical protein
MPGKTTPCPLNCGTLAPVQSTGNLGISLLYLSGVTEITRTLQAIGRDRNRILDYLPL